jgi:pimeloyl-ACP methyl ester carboxylesterase
MIRKRRWQHLRKNARRSSGIVDHGNQEKPIMLDAGTSMRIAFDREQIRELRRRVAQYRRPPGVSGSGWGMGIDLDWFDGLMEYWSTKFDWDNIEKQLNERDHRRVTIGDGHGRSIGVHIVVEPGSNPEAAPILLTAGWPSSFLEYEGVLDRLAHPERFGGRAHEGRTLIVADLPGFGLSDIPVAPIDHRTMGAMWKRLMVDHLGFDLFIAHGGDWGAVVSSWLALDYPGHLCGLHLSMLGLKPNIQRDALLSEAEKAWLGLSKQRLAADGGYRETQATKPNTLAVGLSDSPAALAAWIVEKYHGWTGGLRHSPPSLSPDQMLTAATLYWIGNRLPSANWIYWSDRQAADIALAEGERVEVPTGLAVFGDGFFPPPPNDWAARAYNIVHRRDHPSGGHFAAWIEPEAFAAALADFCRTIT